jgi:hypothetical protein
VCIVDLGDIAREDMMPRGPHNSVITVVITSDPRIAKEPGEKYGVEAAPSLVFRIFMKGFFWSTNESSRDAFLWSLRIVGGAVALQPELCIRCYFEASM